MVSGKCKYLEKLWLRITAFEPCYSYKISNYSIEISSWFFSRISHHQQKACDKKEMLCVVQWYYLWYRLPINNFTKVLPMAISLQDLLVCLPISYVLRYVNCPIILRWSFKTQHSGWKIDVTTNTNPQDYSARSETT